MSAPTANSFRVQDIEEDIPYTWTWDIVSPRQRGSHIFSHRYLALAPQTRSLRRGYILRALRA